MNRSFYCFKFLWLYLNFKYNIFDENFFFLGLNIFNICFCKSSTLIWFLIIISTQLSNIFLELKMNSIFNDIKPLNEIILQNVIFIHVNYILISNLSLYPIWFITLFTKIVNEFTSKHNASFYYLIRFDTKFSKPWILCSHAANYLNLLTLYWIRRVFYLYVCLNWFLLFYCLSVLILNLDKNKEGKFFKRRNFISEITGMLINRNPDAHCMRLH